ncbi:hypothetical protein GCM10023175_69650 [Pseudonocardia xishanensis]|uniref:Transcriptional regulator, AbiEi antitoxin, Type IV TA system n=1 Tax=Pseudonocardia xishanensis TaxID=630995 RepID=A0ABP8S4D9_9PSEU
MPRRTIYERCRPGGPWRTLLPGIVGLTNGPPTRDDRRRAALVYAGPGAVLTGLDALQIHGMRRVPPPSGPVHVLIPHDRRRLGAGQVLSERTERLPRARPGRWPLAPLSRAVLDFCRRSRDREQIRTALAEAVQRGGCTPGELLGELNAGSHRGSAVPRSVLTEIVGGVRSVAEAHAREVLLAAGLPAPMWNPTLRTAAGEILPCPDAWFDDVALAWEIDSVEFHYDVADYERTVERHSRMTSYGIVVVHTVPRALRSRRSEVVDELRRAHALARLRPRPDIHAAAAGS